jgi:hypothetical protein
MTLRGDGPFAARPAQVQAASGASVAR